MFEQTRLDQDVVETLWVKREKGDIICYAACGPTPPGEIVLRSAYCNMQCIPCFAYSYSWPERAKKNKDIVKVSVSRILAEFQSFLDHRKPEKKESYNWFRVLGGEPFLTPDSLDDYIRFISTIDPKHYRLFNHSVLIQTNGFILGRMPKDELVARFKPLSNKNIKVVIEVSIKGSNPEEFRIITQSGPNCEEMYKSHIKACENLDHVHNNIQNVNWTAVAGFGIGVTNLLSGTLKNKNYIKTFFHPDTNRPFYHPDNWDELFRDLFSRHVKKYRHKFGEKFPSFGIEDRRNWKSMLHGLRNCSEFGKDYYYDRYKTHKDHPNQKLEEHMNDIIRHFFFGDPSYYYVKLFE